MSQPGTVASADTSAARIPFEPGLEGLRGFVIVGLLCFHAEFGWATGGFLGIATFFTLSGFLLTSLFLAEWEGSGRISLVGFWARRFRRLMPGALLTLLAMGLFGAFVATPSQLERLPDDVFWSLFYLANWHFVWSGADYTALFEAPSPLHHFWSLAVEEQFYFAFPFVVLAGLALGKGSRRAFGGVLLALIAASVGATAWLVASGVSQDRIYYGTDTRMAELLLGALAAVVLSGRKARSAGPLPGLAVLGCASLLAMVVLWAWVDLQTTWLYRGGLTAYALLSVVVIAAAVEARGPVRVVFSAAPIRWLGRVSYGAYLFHWPIYLWLDTERTGLDGVPLFSLRVGITLIVAEASYRFFESPIRSGRWLPGLSGALGAGATFAAVLAVAAWLPRPPTLFDVDREAVDAYVEDFLQHRTPPPNPPPPSLHREVPRLSVFGDSTAVTLSIGLHYQQHLAGTMRLAGNGVALGCAVVRNAAIRTDDVLHSDSGCEDFDVAWARVIAEEQPDVAVVLAAPWDIRDRRIDGDDRWRALGDPVLDRYYAEELRAAVGVLAADGTLVVWLTHPVVEVRDARGQQPPTPYAASDPARIERWNELIFDLERTRPGKVRVLDLRAYIQSLPGGELDTDYRPDKTHLTIEAAVQLSRDWLGGEVLRIYRETGTARRPDSDVRDG